MNYTITFDRPAEQVFRIELESQGVEEGVSFFLPKWRPGRYELQRYDLNISDLKAFNIESGQALEISRQSTHEWKVFAEKGSRFRLEYIYFANKLNGGASYYDDREIYVNPINCLLYRKDEITNSCKLKLNLPKGYDLACSLPREENYLIASDFHELADSPFMASRNLRHHAFKIRGVKMHFWMMGEGNPDLERLQHDVEAFASVQMAIFDIFPVKEYHFLFLFRPDAFRHGVEHQHSTVIVIGPGYKINQPDLYKSFVELCSHELFHTWNVKAIRPIDMQPYDYDRENYSSLHYVTEGVTTYYGDLTIWKAGLWTTDQWLQSVNGELLRFYQKGGKDFTSLEKASFESWVNGYSNGGIPNRKISFYTKGYLTAFLLDIELRQSTNNACSLDEVMYEMYQRFGETGKGYSKEDFKSVVETVSGKDFSQFFERYYYGTFELDAALQAAGAFMGWEMVLNELDAPAVSTYGMHLVQNDKGETKIETVYPGSPALQAGLSRGDELISINGQKVLNNANDLLKSQDLENPVRIHFFRKRNLRETMIVRDSAFQNRIPQFVAVENPTQRQESNYEKWKALRETDPVISPKL